MQAISRMIYISESICTISISLADHNTNCTSHICNANTYYCTQTHAEHNSYVKHYYIQSSSSPSRFNKCRLHSLQDRHIHYVLYMHIRTHKCWRLAVDASHKTTSEQYDWPSKRFESACDPTPYTIIKQRAHVMFRFAQLHPVGRSVVRLGVLCVCVCLRTTYCRCQKIETSSRLCDGGGGFEFVSLSD